MLTATSDGTGKLWSIPPSSTSFTFGCLSGGTDIPPVVVFGLAPVIAALFLARLSGPQARGSEDSEFFLGFGQRNSVQWLNDSQMSTCPAILIEKSLPTRKNAAHVPLRQAPPCGPTPVTTIAPAWTPSRKFNVWEPPQFLGRAQYDRGPRKMLNFGLVVERGSERGGFFNKPEKVPL